MKIKSFVGHQSKNSTFKNYQPLEKFIIPELLVKNHEILLILDKIVYLHPHPYQEKKKKSI